MDSHATMGKADPQRVVLRRNMSFQPPPTQLTLGSLLLLIDCQVDSDVIDSILNIYKEKSPHPVKIDAFIFLF